MQSGAWERIGANTLIINIIKEGVELPIENCAPFCLPNYDLKNKKEKIFLQDEIKKVA